MLKKMLEKSGTKGKMVLLGLIASVNTFAQNANANMVWEKPAQQIRDSISGPVAGAVSLIAVVVAALAWSFTDGGNLMGKAIKIVIAFAIVGGAATLLVNVFGIKEVKGALIQGTAMLEYGATILNI